MISDSYTKVTNLKTGKQTQVLNSEVDALVNAGLMKVGWDEAPDQVIEKVEEVIEQPIEKVEDNKAILKAPEKKSKGKRK